MAYDREFPVGFFNYHIYDDLMIAIISNFLVESQGFTDLFLFMTYDREFAVLFFTFQIYDDLVHCQVLRI